MSLIDALKHKGKGVNDAHKIKRSSNSFPVYVHVRFLLLMVLFTTLKLRLNLSVRLTKFAV